MIYDDISQTRKYLLSIEEASSIHFEVEGVNYTKKKEIVNRSKTTANTILGGTDTLNRLVLFEQTLSEREKEI
jgi:hypothetical protein